LSTSPHVVTSVWDKARHIFGWEFAHELRNISGRIMLDILIYLWDSVRRVSLARMTQDIA